MAAQMIRALSKIKNTEITLVGHSMGAIVANDLVHEFPKVKFSRIIHMGSADSNRNLLQKTFPYLEKNPRSEFWNLCLHPTNEERKQSGSGVAPEGSLLIWLDYFLTNPETTLDRRAGRWENIKWIAMKFEEHPNAHIKIFGRRQLENHKVRTENGLTTGWPLKHGDFSQRLFWDKGFYGAK